MHPRHTRNAVAASIALSLAASTCPTTHAATHTIGATSQAPSIVTSMTSSGSSFNAAQPQIQGDKVVEARLRQVTRVRKGPGSRPGGKKKRPGVRLRVRELIGDEWFPINHIPDLTALKATHDIRALDKDRGAGFEFSNHLFIPHNPAASPKTTVDLGRELTVAAYDAVTAPAPVPATSPGISAKNPPIVGLPLWFWANGAVPVTAEAVAVAGNNRYVVTATATPRAIRWTAADGKTTFCPHLGTPWAPGKSEQNACTFTYDNPVAAENATISMGWTVTTTYRFNGSTISGPEAQQPFATSADVNFSVYERHALSS